MPLSQLFVKLQGHDRNINDHSLYNTPTSNTNSTPVLKHDLIAGIELSHETYSNQSYTRDNLPVVAIVDPAIRQSPAAVTTTVGNYAEFRLE